VKLGDVARVIYARLRPQVLLFIHALSCHNRWREVNIPLELSSAAVSASRNSIADTSCRSIRNPRRLLQRFDNITALRRLLLSTPWSEIAHEEVHDAVVECWV
jgi:hypothetical protein